MAHYLQASEQIPTVLACDVLLDEQQRVTHALGVIVQTLPDSDRSEFEVLRTRLLGGALSEAAGGEARDVATLAKRLLPEGRMVGDPVPLQWRCRCSQERAVNALRLLDPAELAEMVDESEPAEINCQFCNTAYSVDTANIERVFQESLIARNV